VASLGRLSAILLRVPALPELAIGLAAAASSLGLLAVADADMGLLNLAAAPTGWDEADTGLVLRPRLWRNCSWLQCSHGLSQLVKPSGTDRIWRLCSSFWRVGEWPVPMRVLR